jgi:hypothetical protein
MLCSALSSKKGVSVHDPGWPNVYKIEYIAAYISNNEHVLEVVPSEQLLIQYCDQGWKVLAEFLDKHIPSRP